MGTKDEDTQTLTQWGLNRAQAKVYLSLIKTGPAKVQDISRASEVARSDVYRTIAQLQELGVVEEILTAPVRFKAILLADAVSILLHRRNKKNTELQEETCRLLQKYKDRKENEEAPEKYEFVLIPEKEALIRELRKAMENSKEEINLIIPLKKLLPTIRVSSESFKQTVKRRVTVQIITEKPEDDDTLFSLTRYFNGSPHFEARTVLKPLAVNFGIYDHREIMLSTSAKADFAAAPIMWSNNPDLVELANNYFEITWITAMETKKEILKIENTT